MLELLDNWPDGGTVIFEQRTAAVDERRTAAKQLLAAMSKLGADSEIARGGGGPRIVCGAPGEGERRHH